MIQIAKLCRAIVGASVVSACALYRSPPIAPAPPDADRAYSRAEIAADVDSLFATIEHVHPNPYTVASRDSVQRARERFVSQLPEAASRREIYPGLARLVALLGDGHTSVNPPNEDYARRLDRGERYLPLAVDVDENSRIRISGGTGGVPEGLARGDLLLTINGHNVDSLFHVMIGETSGETEWHRARIAANTFSNQLWYHHVEPPYTVTARGDDGEHSASIVGITRDSARAILARSRNTTAQRPPNFTYRQIDGRIGYMNFYSMAGDLASFKSRLADLFSQVNRDSVGTLVVDLRENPGGDSGFGDALLGHFASHPYRLEAGKEWRMSDEYRARLRSGLSPILRWIHAEYLTSDGRRLSRARTGSIVEFPEQPHDPEQLEPRYHGSVCVLIGRGTFSSAVQLADAIKTYRLATLLGENTGGFPSAFGEVYPFRLPHTSLLISVSSARFLRASGDSLDHGPVRPDVELHRTADDIRAGRDPVLDRARRCSELSS